jgi:hypothetical protein
MIFRLYFGTVAFRPFSASFNAPASFSLYLTIGVNFLLCRLRRNVPGLVSSP